MKSIYLRKITVVFLMATLLLTGIFPMIQSTSYGASSFEAQLSAEGFPESYKVKLRELHEKHPNWIFKAKQLPYTWSDALDAQYKNPTVNLIARSFPDAYKAVKDGTYDFQNHDYIGKDGYDWVTASRTATAFYMDPRNFLTEDGIFMFESLGYNPSYQKESIVKQILAPTALPDAASAYYMAAAKQEYNGTTFQISPIYLATQTRLELGRSDYMINGHKFNFGGKSFSKCYNAFNIGAFDSPDGSAADKGLVYAAGGFDQSGTSYLRPWNTLEKAIKGGAIFIAEDFMGNNQDSMYAERYNVYNGLASIGKHQYATNVFHATTMAAVMHGDYHDFGVLNEAFTFEIPVFQNMADKPSKKPPTSGNNNCYLDGITLTTDGGEKIPFTKKFDRFTGKYTADAELSSYVDHVNVAVKKNADDTKITITGADNLVYGNNTITIKAKSSSGLASKTYTVTVPKAAPTNYVPKTPSSFKAENQGGNKILLSWKGDKEATGYEVSYRQSHMTKWFTFDSKETSYVKEMATKGTLYDFKVRAYFNKDKERIYSKSYTPVKKQASFGDMGELTGSLFGGYMTMKLTLDPVNGADGYTMNFRQRPDGEWISEDVFAEVPETADEVSSTDGLSEEVKRIEFKKKMSKSGQGYDFKMTPYLERDGVRYYNGISAEKTLYTLKKPTLKVKKKSTNSALVEWSNISGESGYEIYRSTSKTKNFKRVAKATYKKSSYTNNKLTVGKTYYYKVRAYKNTVYGTVVYGPYSAVFTFKR